MSDWDVIIYLLFIGILMFVGKIMKTYLPFLNRIVLPTALLGGALGLIFSDVVINGSYHLDPLAIKPIVYHGLAIGFIALSLKQKKTDNKKKVWSTGMIITGTYALQGFIGIVLVLLFFADRFVGSGMLLALGFGQGPGLATSFGNMWNTMLGGSDTNQIGLALGASYAVVGFIFGGTLGVLFINLITRARGVEKVKRYEDDSTLKHNIEVNTVKEINLMDGLTVQLVIIFVIYFLVWATIYLMGMILPSGVVGDTIFGLINSFNFLLGIGYALIYKVILKAFEKKGKNIKFITNDYILANISSVAFNFMICGAVLTITSNFISQYGVILIVVSAVGGIATTLFIRYITYRVFPKFKQEYFVALFGMLTGTASTGMALLKGVDRNLDTPVAEEMVLGSGTAIIMALPLFVFLMLPSIGWGTDNQSLMNILAMLGCLAYFLVVFVILMFRSRGVKPGKKVKS